MKGTPSRRHTHGAGFGGPGTPDASGTNGTVTRVAVRRNVSAVGAAMLCVAATFATQALAFPSDVHAAQVRHPIVVSVTATSTSGTHPVPIGQRVTLTVHARAATTCAFWAQRDPVSGLYLVRAVPCATGYARALMPPATNPSTSRAHLNYMVRIRGSGGVAMKTLSITVAGHPNPPSHASPAPVPTPTLSITTASVPTGSVGVAYSTTLTALGGTPPYSWAPTSASLPPGLTLDASGAISGTPTAAGTWSFGAEVTDAQGSSATATYAITIAAPTPQIPTSASDNWSGYLLAGGTYTGVSGTFNVPTIYKSSTDTNTSEWVGVDGAAPTDPALLQAGVQERYSAATNSYVVYAWVEELPAPETPIPLPVTPGNEMTVTISQVNAGVWNIDVKNDSTGQYYSINAAYAGPGLSTEWIVEATTSASTGAVSAVGIFSPVTFTQLEVNPVTGSLSRSILVQNGVPVAVPSVLSANGFTVTYGSVIPAAP